MVGYSNELFQREATIGQTYAEKVATELQKRKIPCYATELEFAKNEADRKRFENEQDVILTTQTGCIEVKSRRLAFRNDPTTYPYGTAFVDTVIGWDKKNPRPLAVVLVSQITDAMLVVPVSTQPKWTQHAAFDRVRQINENWYQVKRSDLKTFNELVFWLKDRHDPYLRNDSTSTINL